MKEIKNLFKDKNFISFTLISFIFFILFYEYLDNEIKIQIYKTLSNPVILILLVGLIGLILKYNFTIGIMLALSLVIIIVLKPSKNQDKVKNTKSKSKFRNISRKTSSDNYEGFKNKSYLEKTISKITNSLQEGMNENKKLEASLNNINDNNDDNDDNDNNNNEEVVSEDNNNSEKSANNELSNKLEIPKRKFNLDKREDKILIYSKEVLKDIINRINYEYDDREYLKKYIGNKFEEIIDLLGLLEDE